MRRSHILSMAVLGSVVWAAAVVQGQDAAAPAADAAQGPIVPVHQEPHHRQVFQSGRVRILDLQLPPGDISWFHTHEWPVYYLTTHDSPTISQNLGEEWGAGRRGRGGAPAPGGGPAGRGAAPAAAAPAPAAPAPAAPAAAAPAAPAGGAPGARAGGAPGPARGGRPRLMSDITYAERPNTHRIRNDSTGLFRAMVVVNETAGGDEAVTEEAAGFSGKALSSNRWFRAYRIALAPGEKTPAHEHKAPVVVLQDTAGRGIGAGPMTFEFNEPGQWAFFAAGTRHEISNTGDGRLELIEVEVRQK